MSVTLKNPYPSEYGYYRVGTPINADIGKAFPESPAFEMGILQHEGHLIKDANPTSTREIIASGCSKKTQDAWGFSSDASVKISWFCKASVSAHINKSQNECTSSSSQTITAYIKDEASIMLRRNVAPDKLLRCATDDFRNKIQAIRAAVLELKDKKTVDASKLQEALRDFYRVYGTGFVSKLHLGAIGVFRGEARHNSHLAETKANYGGGVSVSGWVGGISVAADYVANKLTADAGATFEAAAFSMPVNSKATDWVNNLLNQFAGKQLASIANPEIWKNAFEVKAAKAEALTLPARPAKPPVPEFKGHDIDDQIKNMKLRRLSDEWSKTHAGKLPTDAEYEGWVKELKGAAKAARADSIAQTRPAKGTHAGH